MSNITVVISLQDNTFQVVLASDGEKSFVFFTYTDIQWGEAGVGFDAGDGLRYFTLPGSRTAATQDIERTSNVGVAGIYAFRVDLQEIVGPGGERMHITNLCANLSFNCIHVHRI